MHNCILTSCLIAIVWCIPNLDKYSFNDPHSNYWTEVDRLLYKETLSMRHTQQVWGSTYASRTVTWWGRAFWIFFGSAFFDGIATDSCFTPWVLAHVIPSDLQVCSGEHLVGDSWSPELCFTCSMESLLHSLFPSTGNRVAKVSRDKHQLIERTVFAGSHLLRTEKSGTESDWWALSVMEPQQKKRTDCSCTMEMCYSNCVLLGIPSVPT